MRHGQGTYTFGNSFFKYTGEWQLGKMQGHGVFCLGDGSSFEGNFQDGEIDGYGLRRFNNGSTYSGNFKQGERHGEGVFIAAGGERYEGEWEHNQRHGRGELILPNQDNYTGEFQRHQFHGAGVMKYANGTSYDGGWERGRFHGDGLLTYLNGDQYQGGWVDGKRDGDGHFTTSTGYSYTGKWTEDRPVDVPSTLSVKFDELAETIASGELIPSITITCLTQDDGIASGESGRMITITFHRKDHAQLDFYTIDLTAEAAESEDEFAGYMKIQQRVVETTNGQVVVEGLRFPADLESQQEYELTFSTDSVPSNSISLITG